MVSMKIISIFILNYFAFSPTLGALHAPFDAKGLFAAAFTPLDDKGNLALERIPGYARFLKDRDVDGVHITGNMGEGPKMSVKEVKRVITAWVNAASPLGLKVIAVVGGRPFPDALELAKFAEGKGVDAIASLPDLFYKPTTAEELLYATELIAKAAPNTPLIYYDDPGLTKVHVDVVEYAILATKRIPTFKGVEIGKCTDGLVNTVLKGDQIAYIANSSYLMPAVYLDYTNFILPQMNFLPEQIREIVNKGERNLFEEANKLFEAVEALSRIIYNYGELVPAFKAAMRILTGVDVGPPKVPETALSDIKKEELRLELYRATESIIAASEEGPARKKHNE